MTQDLIRIFSVVILSLIPLELLANDHTKTELLTEADIVQHASLAGDYLVSSLDEKGVFRYDYRPLKDTASKKYNWLRHAGTTVALCQLYMKTGKQAYLTAAQKAVATMEGQFQTVEIGKQKHFVLCSPDVQSGLLKIEIKTGGNALAILALLYLDRAQKTNQFKDKIIALSGYLRYTQVESGELRSKYVITGKKGNYSKWRSRYYPGEALLALTEVQKTYPSKENLQCLQKLLNYLYFEWVNRIRGGDNPFDHWGMIALSKCRDLINEKEMVQYYEEYKLLLAKRGSAIFQNKAVSETPSRQAAKELLENWYALKAGPISKPGLAELAREYCLLELTGFMDNEGSSNCGSFKDRRGESCPAATRLEGIQAVFTMLTELNGEQQVPEFIRWKEKINLVKTFLISCQYTESDQEVFKSKYNIIGGVREHQSVMIGEKIRIDYCQHTISALLGW